MAEALAVVRRRIPAGAWKLRGIIAAAILVTSGLYHYCQGTDDAERERANRVIAAVTDYRQRTGSLPPPGDRELMRKLGFEPTGGGWPRYQLLGPSEFRISLAIPNAPFWYYDSTTGYWQHGIPPESAAALEAPEEK